MDFINQLPKTIQILIILSPFFSLMIILGYLLKISFRKAKKYSIFWLVFSIIFGIFYIHGLLNDHLSDKNLYKGLAIILGSLNTYISMKVSKKTKKKK